MSDGGMPEYSIVSEGNARFIFTTLDKTKALMLVDLLNTAHEKYLLEAKGLAKPIAKKYFFIKH